MNSWNLLRAEWNSSEGKYANEECQKFREKIMKSDKTFYYQMSEELEILNQPLLDWL